nr:C076A protein [Hypoxylon sp. CO27-5]
MAASFRDMQLKKIIRLQDKLKKNLDASEALLQKVEDKISETERKLTMAAADAAREARGIPRVNELEEPVRAQESAVEKAQQRYSKVEMETEELRKSLGKGGDHSEKATA